VGFVESNVASRLYAAWSRVIVPQVEIGGSVAEKDALERVAMELGGMVNGDMRGDEGTEST
jgi:hypothetical protein